MKTFFLISSLLLNVLFVVALLAINRNNQPETFHVINPEDVSLTSRRDSFEIARRDVQRFVDSIVTRDGAANERDFVRAFTISAEDMLEVMGLDTTTRCLYTECRAYLGLTSNDEFKLYLTPVKDNRDIFFNFNADQEPTSEVTSSSYVLDLIAPCPNSCDKKSPLYDFSKKETAR